MARRAKRIEHDNHDRWLISYADFVTLLFAFFVVMYSISSVNEGKYKTFSSSLSLALNTEQNAAATSTLPNPQEQVLKNLVDRRTVRLGEQQRRIEERMRVLAEGLRQVMLPMIGEGLVGINQTKRGVVIDISASALFRTGDATLQPGVQEVLRKVAVVMGNENQSIEVEGHTDDVPIRTVQFPSNWELSSARASSVARFLIENGVAAPRLSVVGLASNQPLVPNDSPEHRAKNRRVTITILSPNLEREGPGADS